nr:unnamed protein product [Digitaria exilis]
MADDDRLSALGDDLLRRILHFVPFKEAAATSVLSRRWGSLWRSSGAVNLDVRIRNDKGEHPSYEQRQEAFFSHRDAFVRAATAALDAADAPVTRPTLRVVDEEARDYHEDSSEAIRFLHGTIDPFVEHGVIGDVVSHWAARGVEELRVAVAFAGDGLSSAAARHRQETNRPSDGTYRLSLAVPLIHVRVLDLTRCTGLTPPPAMDGDAFFPRLETLRLQLCSLDTSDVQALMDAAPRLATVHLESVFFSMGGVRGDEAPGGCVRLHCRAVTELVMDIEIDAPRLRYFRYKGSERPFSLTSLAPDLVEVDVHFHQERYTYLQGLNPEEKIAVFWQFVRNFTSARVLKLKVNNLEDIAVGKARRTELLCTFRNAVPLELEGVHRATTSKAAAVAIPNLLRCCPALGDLRLKLSTERPDGL